MTVARVRNSRVPGTRTGPIYISLSISAIYGTVLAFSAERYWDGTQICIAIALLAWILRALHMGVMLSPRGITIRSWFFTRTYSAERISGYEIVGYSGTLNAFTRLSIDPFYLNTRMLTLSIGGKTKEFPSTICSRKSARRLKKELRCLLDSPERPDKALD